MIKSTDLFLQYEIVRKNATKTLLDNLENRVMKYIREQFSRQLRSEEQDIKDESGKHFLRRASQVKRAKRTLQKGKTSMLSNEGDQEDL